MDPIFLGTITVVLDGPALHGLSARDSDQVVEDFLIVLRKEVEAKAYPFQLTFELESTRSGCITAKIKVWLRNTVVGVAFAAAVVTKYPDLRRALPVIVGDVAHAYECKVHGEATACSVIRTTLGITEYLYQVKKGDTLVHIVADKWKVPAQRRRQVIAATVQMNPSAFVRGDMNQLKEGALLAKPTEQMLKGVRASPKG